MPKLNYVPPPPPIDKESSKTDETEKVKRVERLDVLSEKERNEMDFSKICEDDDVPPDLELI